MFNKIVWATDGSAGADHALGYARNLARTTGAELEVFEAWFGELFDELFGPHR